MNTALLSPTLSSPGEERERLVADFASVLSRRFISNAIFQSSRFEVQGSKFSSFRFRRRRAGKWPA
jgi:hypothetical protein